MVDGTLNHDKYGPGRGGMHAEVQQMLFMVLGRMVDILDLVETLDIVLGLEDMVEVVDMVDGDLAAAAEAAAVVVVDPMMEHLVVLGILEAMNGHMMDTR